MENLKEEFLKVFRFTEKNTKKKITVRIKVNGEYIVLGYKKKSVWESICAAKSALNCHVSRQITQMILEESDIEYKISNNTRYYSSQDEKRVWKEFMDWAIETKFIEFIPQND